MEEKIRHWSDYALTLGKWLLFSLVVGVTVGVVGAVFHLAISYVTELRGQHGWILYLLPLAGLLIVWAYHVTGMADDKGHRIYHRCGAGGENPPHSHGPADFYRHGAHPSLRRQCGP